MNKLNRSEIVEDVNNGSIELIDYRDGEFVVGIEVNGDDSFDLICEGGGVVNSNVSLDYIVECLEREGEEIE